VRSQVAGYVIVRSGVVPRTAGNRTVELVVIWYATLARSSGISSTIGDGDHVVFTLDAWLRGSALV
jgi:hypothetical protein